MRNWSSSTATMPQRQYQAIFLSTRLESANPHGLISILYEELLRALDVTRVAMEQGRADALRAGQEKASSILLALEASLDMEAGGDLAQTLAGIYQSMQRELRAAVQAQEPDRLQALKQGARDLFGAWVQISAFVES